MRKPTAVGVMEAFLEVSWPVVVKKLGMKGGYLL
jgi:hypothetical protein